MEETRGRTLRWLAGRLPGCRLEGDDGLVVRGLAIDSRRVRPGDVFAALPGSLDDGLRFVPEAISRGAVALLLPEGVGIDVPVPCVRSPWPRRDAARAAHRLAGDPGRVLELCAVTGTNGKTTTAWLLRHLLATRIAPWGCLGTVANRWGKTTEAAVQTTPDPVSLARMLVAMRAEGMSGCALEVSSHALDQDRIAGLRFDGAVFTNLSRDHLDYHGTMDSYRAAKLRLLEHLAVAAPTAYPADDPAFASLAGRAGSVGFGHGRGADLHVDAVALRPDRTSITFSWRGGTYRAETGLVGAFNVLNVAGALALGLGLGRPLEALTERLRTFPGVPGRMQRIASGDGRRAIVDYAHTPDAIEKVLSACRELCSGRLIVVVGAGGDRDRGKRPLMGRAAARGSDVLVLTSDNPRSEDPERILDEVASGAPHGHGEILREPDRRIAIARAASLAEPGDLVCVLGKGHEAYQEVEDVCHPFDDAEEVTSALREAEAGG